MHIFRTAGTLLLLIILLIILIPSNLSAQWSNDPTQNTLVQAGGTFPMIESDGEGGCFLVYSTIGLKANHIDRDGYMDWPGGVSVGDYLDSAGWGDIALSDDGSLLVTYMDCDVDEQSPGQLILDSWVRVQKIDPNGTCLWDEGIVVSLDDWEMWMPQIESDGEGGAVVVYFIRESFLNPYRFPVIQRISATGERIWGDEGITYPDSSTYWYNEPHLTATGNGEFVFQYYKLDSLVFQRFDLSGNILWDNPPMFFSYGDWIHMVPDDSGGVFVTERWNPQGPRTLRALRIDSSGDSFWGEGVILDESLTNNYGAKLVKNEDGSITLVWQCEYPIRAKMQRVSPVGEQLLVSGGQYLTDLSEGQGHPVIINSHNNSNIVIWTDGIGSDGDLFGQRFDIEGINLWSFENVLVSDREELQGDLGICSDMAGGAIICWEECACTYIQQISSDGQLGYVTKVTPSPEQDHVTTFELLPAFPNPFNSSTRLSFILNAKPDIDISIYNTLGRQIWTSGNGVWQAGLNEVIWNANGLGSGVYLVEFRNKDYRRIQRLVLNK